MFTGMETLIYRAREESGIPDVALQDALTCGRGPGYNATWPSTLVHRISKLLPVIKSRIAAMDENGNSITYGVLSLQIFTIASTLLRSGFKPGSRIAVLQKPSLDWIASVIAILYIGAVYVPLDVNTPLGRLSLMAKDCQPVAVLTHKETASCVKDLQLSPATLIIDVCSLLSSSDLPTLPQPCPAILAEENAPAMILYTSGTTGVPKGVVLRHDSLKHEFDHCAAVYNLSEHDVVLQQSAWSFDLSVTQLFLALGVGARLVIVPSHLRADPRVMMRYISENGITITYATPTEYKSWLRLEYRDVSPVLSWRLALLGGEKVTEGVLHLFRQGGYPNLRLFNIYGPTETTCGSTKTELLYKNPSGSTVIPVGRASANECFYILDQEKRNLLPCGQVGEIAIGGVGVAMGYLNKDDLTQASFLHDPYASEEYIQRGWTTMYLTGDMGYLQADGSLVLKGRISGDTQVKCNGIRIELADIEQTIIGAANGILSNAVACIRHSTGDTTFSYIVVYVVFSSSETSDTDKNYFVQNLFKDISLPQAILPAAIVPICSLPRTLTGKVDRRAIASLPIPQSNSMPKTPFTVSSLKQEAMLRGIWQMVIPRDIYSLNQMLHGEMSGLGSRFDWAAETALSPELETISHNALQFCKEIECKSTKPPRVVVLTGATGFVGRYLVRCLVTDDNIERVICIATRNVHPNQKFEDGLASLAESKIEHISGDLSLPCLGMTASEASRIFAIADAVIHNGADVSHLKAYRSLRQVNVVSTKELVKLCLPRHIPLHYVSTTDVCMYASSGSETSMSQFPPPTDGLYGYPASKWVSEVYLEAVSRCYALKVCIYRLPNVVRPDLWEANEVGCEGERVTKMMATDDIFQNLLCYSQKLNSVPSLAGSFDFVKPETVADSIVQSLTMRCAYGVGDDDSSSNATIYHIGEKGNKGLEKMRFREFVERKTGAKLQEVPIDEWIMRAQSIGMSSLVATVLGAGQGLGQMNFET
ncbi:hypothetical protein GQX73_g3786 [Xylaria multiplex]|uniref:Carrier domain-containing protein n=1 Tax=Xylaria multiplex TaxID=323545 RepID=A0A7C8IS75_9PEZI|nr:hypothetical protein GQX73_g3786 [Xylaria multiplex]